ncbi:hypothetical protein C8Q74DRAFT_217939 [Fomes fomentarius]|nr:hypothetical protein C8Q74DRAFT_217939 [Fomes fomentarius]
MNATTPAPAAPTVAPKRPLNKFFVYRREKAREVRDNHGHDNAGNVPSDGFSKWVSNLWAAEPPEVKEYYKRLADQEKEIHQRDYPGYQYKPQRKTKSSLSRKQRKEEERRRIDTIRRALSRASMSSASSDDSGLLTPLDAIDFSVPQDLSYLLKDNAEPSQVDREPEFSNSAPTPPAPSVPSVQNTTPSSVPQLPLPLQNSQWSNTLAQWPQGAQLPGSHLQPQGLPPQFFNPQALSRFLSASGFLGNQQAFLSQIPSHSLFPAMMPNAVPNGWNATCAPLNSGFCDFSTVWGIAGGPTPSSATGQAPSFLPGPTGYRPNPILDADLERTPIASQPQPAATQAQQPPSAELHVTDPLPFDFNLPQPLDIDELFNTPVQSSAPETTMADQGVSESLIVESESDTAAAAFRPEVVSQPSTPSFPGFDSPVFEPEGAAGGEDALPLDVLAMLGPDMVWPEGLKAFGIGFDN